MAWACARTLAATAGPMEPPEHTSEPKWTYGPMEPPEHTSEHTSRCTTQPVPGMAISLPCSRYSSRLADLDRAPRISTSATDLPRSQLTAMPRLSNTSATMAQALRTADATPMLLRSTQQKHESSAYVKSDGMLKSNGWSWASPLTTTPTSAIAKTTRELGAPRGSRHPPGHA